MAHLFQANMPPMVEAKMIARMTQQIMIMIFFCSIQTRREKAREKQHHFADRIPKEGRQSGSGRGRGDEGKGKWIWLPEPGV